MNRAHVFVSCLVTLVFLAISCDSLVSKHSPNTISPNISPHFFDSTLIDSITFYYNKGDFSKADSTISSTLRSSEFQDECNIQVLRFYKHLISHKKGMLSIIEIDSLLEKSKGVCLVNFINALQLKSLILYENSIPNQAIATTLFAEYLSLKLDSNAYSQLVYLPWSIHSIILYSEYHGTEETKFHLERFSENHLASDENLWMYFLYRTSSGKIPINEIKELESIISNYKFSVNSIRTMTSTHLALMANDREYSINFLKKEMKKENLKCSYNKVYLIDKYLNGRNLNLAKKELETLNECTKKKVNAELAVYYNYQMQRYTFLKYKETKTSEYLIQTIKHSKNIIESYNSENTNLINEHYADVIYTANNILFECLYLLQYTKDRLPKKDILKHLIDSKVLYSQISDSRNIIKEKKLTDVQFHEISKIQFRISQNELLINNYQDTLMKDMSIYEDIYTDYGSLNQVLSKVKNTQSLYNSPTNNLITKLIDETDLILDFVKTDSCYFMFILNKDEYNVEILELGLVESSVRNINAYLKKGKNINEHTKKLFKFIKKQIKPLTKHLYIVPDGKLFDIPLEIIHLDTIDALPNITFSYLSNSGKYFDISDRSIPPIISLFSYSDNVTLQDKSELKISEQLNGYNEAKSVSNTYSNSTLVAGKNMTNENIFSSYDAPILHFTCHAYSSSTNQLNNYIFTRDKKNGKPVPTYGFQLKTKSLENNLVILSACNSGTGVQKPGTGVFSLSRDFLQAGAQTVIKSLWAVNEASTKELMVEMHTNFTNGQSIGEALANAKRTVKKMPGYEHPYYWAGFVLEGNPHVYLELEEEEEEASF